jgi:pimeloyl-ACP methyl ester carboxylesterase
MSRVLKLVLGVLLLVAVVYGGFDFGFPRHFAAAALDAERSAAGLKPAELDIPGFHITYLEGGQGRTLLLLHGFGADKDNWTRVSRTLTRHYHVVAVDLPGYGDSTRPSIDQVHIADNVRYVSEIAEALQIDRFDLGGSSMGGWIAASYAAAHPEQVDSLWLLDPAGVASAQPSDLVKTIRSGGRVPLIAQNTEEYQELLDFVFVHRPFVPHAVIKVLAQHAIDNYDFYKQVFGVLEKEPPLEPQVKNLQTPTLIVWGDHDRALDLSGADILHQLMPRSQVDIMPDIGHLPMIEAPAQTAADYIKFREGLQQR